MLRSPHAAPKKHKGFALTLIVILLAACTPAAPTTPTGTPTLSPTPTTTPFTFRSSATPVPTGTRAAGPQSTSTDSTATPASVSIGPTPTFNAAAAVTRTPLPPALCPSRNLTVNADEAAWDAFIAAGDTDALFEALQYHLNIGGAPGPAEAALRRYRGTGGLSFYQEQDVTGDDLPDFVFAAGQVYVLFCAVGFYELQEIPGKAPDGDPAVLAIADLNRTGVPEIVLHWEAPCGAGSCGSLAVLEWNGRDFVGLIENDPENKGVDTARMDAAYSVRIRDTDANGTVEILLDGEVPTGEVYRDGLPWRERTDTYMWNGVHFDLHRVRYGTPDYRFQAVQDGDLFTSQGDYDQALLSYQLAVFGDAPEWWSPDRAEELHALWEIQNGGEAATPTPSEPDPAEYGVLAAYARFRIFVLYLLNGWESDAEIVYTTLIETFPEGEDGSIFAETATAFWEEYQETKNIGAACARAVAVIEENPDMLFYLGAEHHGWQSRIYTPADVCPFGGL